MASAFVRVPVAEGRNPFRVVRRPESRYSCRGVDPFGVTFTRHRLEPSGLEATAMVLGWREDPRGDCGACPGCKAFLAPDGVVWMTVAVAEGG